MLTSLLAIFMGIASAGADASPPLVQDDRAPVTAALLADALSRSLREHRSRLDDLELSFTVTHYVLSDGHPPPELSNTTPYIVEDWTLLCKGAQYHITRVFRTAPTPDLNECVNVFHFDGMTARAYAHLPARATGVQDRSHQGAITLGAHKALRGNLVFFWLGHELAGRTLGDLLTTSKLPQVVSDETTSTHFRLSFPDPDAPSTSWSITVAPRDGDHVVRSVEFACHDADSGALYLRQMVTFDQSSTWPHHDAPVSSRFTSVTTYPNGVTRSGTPQWGATTIELTAVQRRSLASVPPVRFPVGTGVWDSRYRIGYDVGGHLVNIDGRQFIAAVAMPGDMDIDLASLMADGHFSDIAHTTAPWYERYAVLVIGSVGAVLLLVIPPLLGALRRKRNPSCARDW